MLVFRDHERGYGVVRKSEPRPLHTGTRKSWVRIQKRLNTPFAPHLDARDYRRASRRVLQSTVMLRGMRMDVLGVMCKSHLRPPESPHTASAQPQDKFRKICTGPVFWSGAGRQLSALSATKASAAALMEASQARRNAPWISIGMRMRLVRRQRAWVKTPSCSTWRIARERW